MKASVTRDEARAALAKRSKKLTQNSFVKAVASGSRKLVELYLDAGLDPNGPDPEGTTPLLAAVSGNDLDLARLLHARGASADDPALFFHAVYAAPFVSSTEMVDWVASVGAPLDFVDEKTGWSALELARGMGDPAVIARVESLFEQRAGS